MVVLSGRVCRVSSPRLPQRAPFPRLATLIGSRLVSLRGRLSAFLCRFRPIGQGLRRKSGLRHRLPACTSCLLLVATGLELRGALPSAPRRLVGVSPSTFLLPTVLSLTSSFASLFPSCQLGGRSVGPQSIRTIERKSGSSSQVQGSFAVRSWWSVVRSSGVR